MTVEALDEPRRERPRSAPLRRGRSDPGDMPAGSVPGGSEPGGSEPGRESAGGALAVAFRHAGPVCVLSLSGALTTGTLGVLEAQMDRLGRTTCHRVVIDAAGLTAVDDAGARVLTGLHHYVTARGGRMHVTGAPAGVARVLASTPLLAG